MTKIAVQCRVYINNCRIRIRFLTSHPRYNLTLKVLPLTHQTLHEVCFRLLEVYDHDFIATFYLTVDYRIYKRLTTPTIDFNPNLLYELKFHGHGEILRD